MSLRQWSEQILLGDTLADKLATAPDGYADPTPGAPLPQVLPPGRPAFLPLHDDRPRVAFPGPGTLSDPQARGRVLHFFANHELLALELMALVLLRFPDAPRPFRRGLAKTMAEEQRHLSLYLDRMAELGVAPGEIPVNDFFWSCLSGVASPLAFVAGMSLTFEQANLDFSLYYRDAFAAVGDRRTAGLMQEVYDDEVGHVRHGLRWLRRWKPPGLDEWQAHKAFLQRPLTAARARGRAFSRPARKAAGLPKHYIDQLEVYRHSRGRPPRVFYFNPGCEEEIALQGQRLPAAALQVQADLQLLPAVLAAEDDAVIVSRMPDTAHLQRLQQAGLSLPELIHVDGAGLEDHPVTQRTLGGLQPWGWSPTAARFLAPLGGQWDPEHARRAGKSLATTALRTLLDRMEGEASWLAEAWTIGTPCTSIPEVDAAVAAIHRGGHEDVVIKAEWGAAGRNAIRMMGRAARSAGQDRWLQRILRQQGCVVVEPWLRRVLDLSLHYDRRPNGTMKSVGAIRFATDARGQYRGHFLGRLADGLPQAVIQLLYGGGRAARRMRTLSETVGAIVGEALGNYAGPVGVDALVFEDRGRLRIKPIVEINPRWSMGRVALVLQRRVQPGVPAWFALLRAPDQQAACRAGGLEIGPGGQWVAGTLCLTEPASLTAVALIGPAAQGWSGY